ncbi:MAG TPA: 23S rRNA (pseudouridine(1915)-N(3))-methyltransferase RlmH [Gemmatimonadaceae bacterium]|nr:23S rRNA (pseudouridine(1915)-N(3))-methyltransferase RlmH [Gemmatimonadaceae bacterium]
MRVILAVVGKPRDPALAAAIRDYETRAARYWPLDVYEVREEPARANPVDVVREREGERLRGKVPGAARLVVCERDGTRYSSEHFATFVQQAREDGRDLAFTIGGAYGLPASLTERAAARLELAPWTLPHELARLVLAEQLYRAGTIVRGEPYHK